MNEVLEKFAEEVPAILPFDVLLAAQLGIR